MSDIFTSITLSDGRKCDFKNITGWVISRAQFRMDTQKEDLDIIPYILEQVVIIGGQLQSKENLLSLYIDDYFAIIEVVNVIMTKVR